MKDMIFHPGMFCSLETWQTIFDVVRFKYLAVDILGDEVEDLGFLPSVQDYLEKEGYSHSFCDSYLVPLLSALWRTNAAKCLSSFPVKSLVRFMYDHEILSTPWQKAGWRTIQGGMEEFIKAMSKTFPADKLHLRTRVVNVEPADMDADFTLRTNNDELYDFDHIIFAVDGEEVLKICSPLLDVQETNIISGLRTSKTVGVLHSDASVSDYVYVTRCESKEDPRITFLRKWLTRLQLMPNDAQRWSACNYISNPYSRPKAYYSQACLTYWENDIHNTPLSRFGSIFVTLNPFTPPHPRLVQGIWEYTSPELSASALNAQRELSAIQNTKGLSYCGSWTGCNFYEETVTNGLKVATEHLGARLPFQIIDYQAQVKRHYVPYLSLKNTVIRMALRLLGLYIWMGGIVLRLLGLISVVRFTPGSSSNKASKSA